MRSGKRFLVIDDHPDTAHTLAHLIELLGGQARSCTSPAGCVELARDFRPEIVLLDLAMPELDGFAVAAALRTAELQPFRLIAVSGRVDAATRERCRAAGFDDFILKPISVESLQKLIAAGEAAGQ
jgi:CheY-like chemotaxis protein